MRLNETVLERLVEASDAKEGRRVLVVPDKGAGWTVALTVDRHEQLGCAVWEMALQRTRSAPAEDTVGKWADRAAGRVSSLLERLQVYEVDAQRNEALLRSAQPTQRGNNAYYYEALLQGTTHATVRRFQGSQEKGKRAQVAFVMTHEQVAKLASDLAAD